MRIFAGTLTARAWHGSSVRVGFVVDVHQLADGGVRVFLRGGEGLVTEKLLNGAKISAIGEKMRGEGVTQRVRVQIPIHVSQANVFFDDTADGTLRQPTASVIQKDRFTVRGTSAPPSRTCLQEQLFANGPISFQRLLRFAAVGHDAFVVAFAAYTQHFLATIHVDEVQSSQLADAQARCVEKLQQSAVASQEQPFVARRDALSGTSG